MVLQTIVHKCTYTSRLSIRVRFTVFIASRPCGPAGWLARTRCSSLKRAMSKLIQVRQSHTNMSGFIYICQRQIYGRMKISVRCKRIEHWVKLRSACICLAQYSDAWTCHLHMKSRLLRQRDITTPHPPRSGPKFPPTPPDTNHTPATQTETNVPHSPRCKSQIQSSHPLTLSPPTMHRAKHVYT